MQKNIAKNVYAHKLCEFIFLCNFNSRLLNENYLRVGRNFSNLLNIRSKGVIYNSNSKIFPCICWLKSFFEIYESNEQNEYFSKSFIIFFGKALIKNLIENKSFKFDGYNFHLIEYNEELINPKNLADKILFGDFKFEITFKKRKERKNRPYFRKNRNQQGGQQSNLVKGESFTQRSNKVNNQNSKIKKQKVNFPENMETINLNKPGPSGIKVIEAAVNKTTGGKSNGLSSKSALGSQNNKKQNFEDDVVASNSKDQLKNRNKSNLLKKSNDGDSAKLKPKMQTTQIKNDNKQVPGHAAMPINDNNKNDSKKGTQRVETKTAINKEKSKTETKEQCSISGETKDGNSKNKNKDDDYKDKSKKEMSGERRNNTKENLKSKETAKISSSNATANVLVTGSSIKLERNVLKDKNIEKESQSAENKNEIQVKKELQISLFGILKAINYPFLDLIKSDEKDCGEWQNNISTTLCHYMKRSTCFCKKNRMQVQETNDNNGVK